MLNAQSIRSVAFGDEVDTAEERLKVTQFLVEATNNEWHTFWARWCKKSQECREPLVHNWEQLGGWTVTVDLLEGRPICISLNWDRLDGFLVCQWEAVSELVDHKLIEEWLDKYYTGKTNDGRRARCNSSNFHHCIHELEAWKKSSRDGEGE